MLETLKTEKEKRIVISEYIFPNQNGKKPADIRSAWENAVQEAGLSTDVCFHSLRHTAASHLAMNGFSLLEIGSILGHKSFITKRYSHLSTASTAKALNRLNDEFFGEYLSG